MTDIEYDLVEYQSQIITNQIKQNVLGAVTYTNTNDAVKDIPEFAGNSMNAITNQEKIKRITFP